MKRASPLIGILGIIMLLLGIVIVFHAKTLPQMVLGAIIAWLVIPLMLLA